MHCTHCGKEIDEIEVEAQGPSILIAGENADESTRVEYVCPRCGHLIHDDLSEEEIKELARASHAEIQRGNNSFSTGMSFLCVGIIVLIISIIFFRLSMKAANNFRLSTNCIEFYVFIVTLVVAIAGITTGIIFTSQGLTKKHHYQNLLKDIQNETFIQ